MLQKLGVFYEGSECKVGEGLFEFDDLHRHVDRVWVHAVDNTAPLRLWQQSSLCDKVDCLTISGKAAPQDSQFTPGEVFRKLKFFKTSAENCMKGWVLELFDRNPLLISLEITTSDSNLPPGWFDRAAERCRNIRSLCLRGYSAHFDEKTLWKVSDHFSSLRTLNIDYSGVVQHVLCEPAMIVITWRCPLLESISLNKLLVSAAAASAICANCRHLTALTVPSISLTLNDLQHLLPQHRTQSLTALACRWALQDESEVHACAALFSGLQKLEVTFSAECECAISSTIQQLRNVQVLTMTMLGREASAVVQAVAQSCRQLQMIFLNSAHCDETSVVAVLANNRYLRRFQLNGAEYPASDAVLYAFARYCPLMEHVRGVGVSDAAVQALAAGCAHLTVIAILDSVAVTDAGLSALGTQCRHLVIARILNCQLVTEAGLMVLVTPSPSFFYLSLKHSAIDAAAVERIKKRRGDNILAVDIE